MYVDAVLELGLHGGRVAVDVVERRHRVAAESYGDVDIVPGRGAEVGADLRIENQAARVVLYFARVEFERAFGRQPPAERQSEERRDAFLEEVGAEMDVQRDIQRVESHRVAVATLECGVVEPEVQQEFVYAFPLFVLLNPPSLNLYLKPILLFVLHPLTP